ncbi:MAG: hypothetical protein Q8N27_02755 [Candidatus Hydromicrobium sp.]|nr:hypothetical protein [Candidatus Hydromicrobium sp.]
MRKKRIIITVVVAFCVLVGSFFIMRFGVLGRIYNAISRYVVQDKVESEEESPEEFMYETEHDKDGTEFVVEYRKQIGTNLKTGEEVEIWEDTADPKIIYDNYYKGKIEKIEDNKIYFMVDKEEKEETKFVYEDVKDYQVVFDIDTYNFEEDPSSHYWCDSILVNPKGPLESSKFLHSAGELEFVVGEYLGLQDYMCEDYYTGNRYKTLVFYLY